MFNVGRFDPKDSVKKGSNKKEKTRNAKKVRLSDGEGSLKASPLPNSMRVIAPEQTSITTKHKFTDEAMDDFDMDELLLESVENDFPSEVEHGNAIETLDKESSSISKEIDKAIYMSSLPIEDAARMWNLAPFLIENLKKDGYESFFPIQSLVIPDVITSERNSKILQCRDVCVAAPTGSGKTLAFTIPLLNALSSRMVRRLRALIVLPSRDLAIQIYHVVERYSQGSNLRVGLAVGQSDFSAEQQSIMLGEYNPNEDLSILHLRHLLDPSNLEWKLKLMNQTSKSSSLQDLNGNIDILVATPGRLIDHLEKTPGFSLQHLRFLVVDEADRLLSQSYHSFIGRIMESVNSKSDHAWSTIQAGEIPITHPITWRRPAESFTEFRSIHYRVCQQIQLRKLLFSATMTKDPQKLASLGLNNPKFFDAHQLKAGGNAVTSQRYSMPLGLTEYIVECTAEQKPLFLLALLRDYNQEGSILVVFTSSLDSTHRLARLLQLLWKASGAGEASCVAEFSSALSQDQRSHLVQRCNDRKSSSGDSIRVVVCSDGLSRGMDLASVSLVVNYDVPGYAKTYVHRCGRTARAGREGIAISLLKSGQIHQFRKMRELIESPNDVTSLTIKKDLIRDTFSKYKKCVATLRDVIQGEKNGTISPIESLPSEYLT
jgi:ATP-dependent RNA helicase DDX51/DBP6